MSDNPGQESFTEKLPETPYIPAEATQEELPTVLAVPKPPQPSFWWAVPWTLAFLLITQGAGAIIGIAALFVYAFLQPDPMTYLQKIPTPAFKESPGYSLMLALAFLHAQLVSWILSLVVIRVVIGKGWMRQLALRLPSLSHLVLGILGLPALWVFAVGLDQLTKRYVPSLINMEDVAKQFGQWPLAFGIFVVGVGPALGEELWFRGFLGRGLVGRYGVLLGTVLASILFGIIHVEPRQVIYAPVLGMAFHLVYLATRSFWMPVLLHFLNNAVGVALAWSLKDTAHASTDPQFTSVWGPLIIFPAAAVLVGVIGYALYKSQARIGHQPVQDGELPWQPDFPGVECPPRGSGAYVWHPPLRLHEWGFVGAGVIAFGLACYIAIALKLLA